MTDEGLEIVIPNGMCPRCWPNEIDLEVGEPHPAPAREIDTYRYAICRTCEHRQLQVVDNPAYDQRAAGDGVDEAEGPEEYTKATG